MQPIDRRQQRRNSYHGKRASGYEAARAGRPQWKAEDSAVRKMLHGATGTVLDCPVGTGRFLALYAKLGLSCVGVDVSDEMLEQAKAKKISAKLLKVDGRSTGLDAASFNSIVCVRLFCHCTHADMRDLLAEFRRLLAPGGSILASARFFTKHLDDYFTEDQWNAALRDNGLKAVQSIDLGPVADGARYMLKLMAC